MKIQRKSLSLILAYKYERQGKEKAVRKKVKDWEIPVIGEMTVAGLHYVCIVSARAILLWHETLQLLLSVTQRMIDDDSIELGKRNEVTMELPVSREVVPSARNTATGTTSLDGISTPTSTVRCFLWTFRTYVFLLISISILIYNVHFMIISFLSLDWNSNWLFVLVGFEP